MEPMDFPSAEEKLSDISKTRLLLCKPASRKPLRRCLSGSANARPALKNSKSSIQSLRETAMYNCVARQLHYCGWAYLAAEEEEAPGSSTRSSAVKNSSIALLDRWDTSNHIEREIPRSSALRSRAQGTGALVQVSRASSMAPRSAGAVS